MHTKSDRSRCDKRKKHLVGDVPASTKHASQTFLRLEAELLAGVIGAGVGATQVAGLVLAVRALRLPVAHVGRVQTPDIVVVGCRLLASKLALQCYYNCICFKSFLN